MEVNLSPIIHANTPGPSLFKVEMTPAGVYIECSGNPLDIMSILIAAMKGNDHVRALILSVSNYWLEDVGNDHLKEMYNQIKNK
jgi:hypothetical protein